MAVKEAHCSRRGWCRKPFRAPPSKKGVTTAGMSWPNHTAARPARGHQDAEAKNPAPLTKLRPQPSMMFAPHAVPVKATAVDRRPQLQPLNTTQGSTANTMMFPDVKTQSKAPQKNSKDCAGLARVKRYRNVGKGEKRRTCRNPAESPP